MASAAQADVEIDRRAWGCGPGGRQDLCAQCGCGDGAVGLLVHFRGREVPEPAVQLSGGAAYRWE